MTCHSLPWVQSVPPAVAGGYVVEMLELAMLGMHPPATAGGTDCIQADGKLLRRITSE